jgi:hypothetical protein
VPEKKLDLLTVSRLDEFAGRALTGLLSDPNADGTPEDFAELAFRYAQAMMRQSKATVAAIEKWSNK